MSNNTDRFLEIAEDILTSYYAYITVQFHSTPEMCRDHYKEFEPLLPLYICDTEICGYVDVNRYDEYDSYISYGLYIEPTLIEEVRMSLRKNVLPYYEYHDSKGRETEVKALVIDDNIEGMEEIADKITVKVVY